MEVFEVEDVCDVFFPRKMRLQQVFDSNSKSNKTVKTATKTHQPNPSRSCACLGNEMTHLLIQVIAQLLRGVTILCHLLYPTSDGWRNNDILSPKKRAKPR